VIELAEQVPAPIRAPVGQDSEEILKLSVKNPTPSWTRSVSNSSALNKQTNNKPPNKKGFAMIEIIEYQR